MKTGLESLDTGAPEITYSGNEGPKSPQQIQQMQMAQLEEEYDAYVDDMLEQGLEPMSMQQFLEQIAAEAQMSSNEEGIGSMMEDPRAMAADGGRMQDIGFSIVKPSKDGSRPGYFSGLYGGGAGDRGGNPRASREENIAGGYTDHGNTGGGSPNQMAINKAKREKKAADEKAARDRENKARQAQEEFTKRAKEKKEKEKREKDTKEFFDNQQKKKKKGFFAKIFDKTKTINRTAYLNNLKKTDPVAYAEMIDELEKLSGQTVPPSMGFKTPDLVSIKSVPPSRGFKETTFGDLSTDFVDLSGTQSYTNPAFGGQYFYGTPTITLANGGRANYAGGGIADLRQGYFLGKLVKGITKPFKKVFKGFKKIAKSPLGKMALLALGGYYAPTLFGGTAGFGPSSTYGKFLSGAGPKANLGGFSKLGEGFKNIAKSAFKPENAFATISGISGLSGLYTNYINNKREDESMAEYQRRLEEERGNFAAIPTDFVEFAANGGRMGFADGGDDDDEDDFRSKALGALYQKLAMGGSAGMPPVTMMSEGQDVQSFGDDESTGMPQATPTMPNQMPMRPPMMDPRMQQQMMMAQRGNPMMNRGMMSMQQPPRIMAQEGGRIGYADAGSVMKDPDEVVAGMDNELNPGIKDQLLKRIDRDMGVDLIDKIQSLKYGKDFLGFDSLGYPETSKNDPMSMEQTIQYLENLFDQHIDEGNDPRKGGYFHDLGVYSKDDIRRRVELGFDLAKGPETQTGIMKAAYGGRIPAQEGGMMDMDRKTILKGIADGVFTFDDLTKYARDKAPKKKNVDPIRQAILKGVADGLFTFDDLTKYDGQGVLPLEEITKPIAEPFYPDRFKDLKPIAEPFYPDRFKNLKPELMAQGGRIEAQEGGMMDMGGMEKDYRNEGGFVPIGGQERADDVPARLSKNEFVFTADAVRNAGGGDIDKGAEIMENMMENLEQGGKVSKASQGLSGAREMFATSQRLEEVL
jgi:hypothetical protein